MPILSSAEGPRPFTRRQSRQNAAFLDALRHTGNARLAAASLGVHRSTYTKRRTKCPAFAAQWEAALAAAHASFQLSGGVQSPQPVIASAARQSRTATLRTQGGEPTVTRLKSGRLQLRLAPPGRMTKAGEQAFFRALSASANVRLSAAAAGFAHSSFYAKRRKAGAFAREMRLALEMGYTQLECAMYAAGLEGSHEDDAWRHNDPPPIPPMTASEALQLLHLHQKEARLLAEPPHIKRRPGESREAHLFRLGAMYEARLERDREAFRIAEAARAAARERDDDAPPPPDLPDLAQVRGWSKACPQPVEGADRAKNPKREMFGGWTLKDWERREAARKQHSEREAIASSERSRRSPGRRGARR